MANFILIYFAMHLHFLRANSIQNFAAPQGTSAANELDSLAICISEISKHELFWRPTAMLKLEINRTDAKSGFISQITEPFAAAKIPYVLTESYNGAFDIQGHQLYVDYFDNIDNLLNFDFGVIKKHIKYLWILGEHSQKSNRDFQSIGNRVGKFDVTFLVKVREAEYKMVTFIPTIDRKSCEEVVGKAVKINTCESGHLKGKLTFPSKNPTNLKRCPFKVGMGALFPFAMIENIKSLKTFDSLQNVAMRGMDVEIIKIISEYFNASLSLYYIAKYEENPYTNKEFLPFIVNGSLDACAGGIYRVYGDVVAYSGIYMRQAVIWMYTADRLPATWQNLMLNIDGLYLFIVFYISYSLVWYIICVFDRHSVSMMDVLMYSWGALVGSTCLPDARSFKQKVVNTVYLNMCLHLSVYISIILYSYLTIRGPPEIFRSNDDVMYSGRTAYLKSLTKYFVKDEKYESFVNYSADCSSYVDCTLTSFNKKGITIIIEGYFIDFQAKTIVNNEARVLRPLENLLVVYYEMLIHKESPLVKGFQLITTRLFEAGITMRLFDEAIGIASIAKAKYAAKNIASNSYSCQHGCTINLSQIFGLIYLWGIGCGVSVFVFVLEVVWKKITKIDENAKTDENARNIRRAKNSQSRI